MPYAFLYHTIPNLPFLSKNWSKLAQCNLDQNLNFGTKIQRFLRFIGMKYFKDIFQVLSKLKFWTKIRLSEKYAMCMHFDVDNLLSRQKGIANGQKPFDSQSHCAIHTPHQPNLGYGYDVGQGWCSGQLIVGRPKFR